MREPTRREILSISISSIDLNISIHHPLHLYMNADIYIIFQMDNFEIEGTTNSELAEDVRKSVELNH